ncbi:MAG: glycosyltransferase family 1 protein [Acidobacteriota bacterium]
MSHTIAIDARKVRDYGIGTYIQGLVRQLAEIDERNRYILLTQPGGQDALRRLPDNFSFVTERAPGYSMRELATVPWRLLRHRVDLYHATHYVLPPFVPGKAVVTIHDIIHLLYPEFLPNRFARLYAERMIRHALNRGDRILTVSETTRTDLMHHFDVDEAKIEVVYNGIDPAFHERLDDDDLERWLDQLGIERPYVLFVGNADKPHKNLENVVKAYARARKRQAFPHPLICVGKRDGAAKRIELRAEQLGVADQVRMIGYVAQEALPAIYQGADLFLYPTLYEGFGLPVVEAMASGVAVITSNTSALKEIAAGYARTVNPLDVDAMAQAIVQLLGDADERQSLAKVGRRRARTFSWRRAAESTLATYRQALGVASPDDDADDDSDDAAS